VHAPVEALDFALEAVDLRGAEETWSDMLRLQDGGVYPAAFASIVVPVLMLHGDFDPHPGDLIRDSLRRQIPHLEHRELAHCGHYPWLERAAAEPFYQEISVWLAGRRSAP
jgi:pimeloyl-ACP methyl ester carboxylesterase